MGVIGCILGFLVVIYLVYKDWSSYLATFFGMCVVVLLTGDSFMTAISETYVSGVYTAIKSFFFYADVWLRTVLSVPGKRRSLHHC